MPQADARAARRASCASTASSRSRELTAACGAGRDCGACKPGLAYLVSEVCDNRHREERHARFINDRVHANIQNDGTFSVVPRMRGGVTTPDELRRIADVADKYEVPMVKVTGGQRIDLLGVRKEQLPAIWEELGMPSGHAYAKAVRTVKTCVGTDFCRFGLGDSIGVGIELERRDGGPLHAAQGQVGGRRLPAQLRGGLRQGHRPRRDRGRLGDLRRRRRRRHRAQGRPARDRREPEEAMRIALVFLQHYREHGEYLERTYGYVERVGIDAVREAVLDADDAGGAARALPDRQVGGRPRPVARAPRPGPPQAVRRARHRARAVHADRRRPGRQAEPR